MERLLHHSVDVASDEFNLTLIGPKGSSKYSAAKRTIECPATPLLFLVTALLKGLLHCCRYRYRYVIGGNGLMAPLTLIFAKMTGASSVVFVHGLDLVAKSRTYQLMFVPWIVRADIVIANSQNTRRIAVEKGTNEEHTFVLNPGAELPPAETLAQREETRRSLGFNDAPIVLFVGRLIQRKGLSSFIENSWANILEHSPNAKLVVVGDDPTHAVARDSAERALVRSLVVGHSFEQTISFLGKTDDHELAEHYLAADVLCFPVIDVEGDVEGFGMVAIEAAAYGTPTVAFATGGLTDAVTEGRNGRLIPAGDYGEFALAVLAAAEMDTTGRARCREHAEEFCWSRYRKRLLDILDRQANSDLQRND